MVRHEVWDLDLLGDCVAPCDACEARVQRRIVDALALGLVAVVESVAREPVVSVARLVLGAVGVVSAVLAVNVSAREKSLLEAVFGSLLLFIGGEIVRVEELVDDSLVLADAVREHSAVVAVVVDAPLNIDDLAGRVRGYDFVPPVRRWLVVVKAHAGVVPTRA